MYNENRLRLISNRIAYCITLVLVVSCATVATFDTNAYKTLASAKVGYTQVMSSLGSLQTQGKLSDSDIQKILPYARAYYQAYLVAEVAYEVYHNNPSPDTQDKLIKLLEDVSVKIGELSMIIAQYNITVEQITIPTK